MASRLIYGCVRALAFSLVITSSGVAAGPCDIYSAGGTPCIAAHGTTRALYDDYDGALYQVQRNSDGSTIDIEPLSAGGVANATPQDDFCAGTTCVITIIYDQSGNGNDLTQAPPGGAASGPETDGYDSLSSAIGAPVTLDGNKAYGVFISPYHGYRNNQAKKTATGDAPEGMYALLDGTHYNQGCCFDYGNAEPSTTDTNNGAMEAIYFGLGDGWSGSGAGDGPWIMADLENNLFSGQEVGKNTANPSISHRFLTTVVKGEPNHWAILGGDGTDGSLSSIYDGPRPNADGYNPMRKEGAIILGIGGDNSNRAQGTFYEGVMTDGYPTDEVDEQVQANIVAAKYGTTPLISGPTLNPGDSISMQVTTAGFTDRYLSHDGSVVNTQIISDASEQSLKQSASWTVRAGLGSDACYSFESNDTPGSFVRHRNYELHVDANDGSQLFHEDATFCPQAGISGEGTSFRSWSIPTRYWRHYGSTGYIGRNGGFNTWDDPTLFNDDVTFLVGNSFA